MSFAEMNVDVGGDGRAGGDPDVSPTESVCALQSRQEHGIENQPWHWWGALAVLRGVEAMQTNLAARGHVGADEWWRRHKSLLHIRRLRVGVSLRTQGALVSWINRYCSRQASAWMHGGIDAVLDPSACDSTDA